MKLEMMAFVIPVRILTPVPMPRFTNDLLKKYMYIQTNRKYFVLTNSDVATTFCNEDYITTTDYY